LPPLKTTRREEVLTQKFSLSQKFTRAGAKKFERNPILPEFGFFCHAAKTRLLFN
jgi:hypothetical protein